MLELSHSGAPILPEEFAEALRQIKDLDRRKSGGAATNSGDAPRVECTLDIQLEVEHPGGGVGRSLDRSRYLSAVGIGLIHKGFLHAGSSCRVTMPTLWGGEEMIDGSVITCRHVQKSLHDMFVRFNTRVAVNHFVVTDENQDDGSAPPINPLDIAGLILLIDDQEAESKLIRHILRNTKAKLITARTMAKALAVLESHPVDLILCDLNLNHENGEDVIGVIVQGGFAGTVIAFTGEIDQARLDAATDAGAGDVFRKPYTAAEFYGMLAKWLGAATKLNGEPIVSTLESEPGMTELLEWYLKQVKSVVHNLEKEIKADSFEDVYGRCRMLKETGMGYGFKILSETAKEALVALDSSRSIPESAETLRRVRSVCGRLSMKRH